MACCSGATRGKWSMAKCLISLARRARFGHTTFAFGEKNGHLRRRSPEYAAVRYHILESLHNFDFILCFNTLRYAAIFTRTASVVLPRKQQFGAMVRMEAHEMCRGRGGEAIVGLYHLGRRTARLRPARFPLRQAELLRHRERCHREESCPRRPETSRSRQDPPAQRGGVSRAW